MIVILHFGSQLAHLIARRVRDLSVFSEILPFDTSAEQIRKIKPDGIILSGGPSSVYEQNAPLVDERIFDLGIPILGICYGLQLIGKRYGTVEAHQIKEFGKTRVRIRRNGLLLKNLSRTEQVWMSHGDSIANLNSEFEILGSTFSCRFAAVENRKRRLYGVQFHPEVVHTIHGRLILNNFLFGICHAKKDFNIAGMRQKLVQEIKETVGDKEVLMAVSGGVDSTVAAVLLHEAIGKRLHCVFVDNGLLRKNEREEVEKRFLERLHFEHFAVIDASHLFLKRLTRISEPEQKRKIIGHTFIEVFEKEAKRLKKEHPAITFLGQGTIYPDRIESAEPSGAASKIKSHHNLTLPEKMKLKVIEPLRDFYKDNVRELGRELLIPPDMLNRHPFPGPGLAIRVVGKITFDKLSIAREADAIFIEELQKSGFYNKIWQALAAVLPVKTVGVMGDSRTYQYMVSLRAVTSTDAMTADWAKLPPMLLERISSRIVNEVAGVNRVVYDITQKPPGTIEYE